jgi:hypothetical protein
MSRLVLRSLLLLLAAMSVTAGDEFFHIQAGRGPTREALGFLLHVAGWIGAIGLAGIACLPRSWLSRLLLVVAPSGRECAPDESSFAGRRIAWCVSVASTAVLIATLAVRAPYQTEYAGTDQAAYVETATAIARDGGPRGLLGDLWTGQFAEANRHPLYLALLSVRPTFDFGKWLAATGAVLVHLLGLWQTTRWYGRRAGIGFALLNGLNSALINTGVTVACETLVALWMFAAFWWAHRSGAVDVARIDEVAQIDNRHDATGGARLNSTAAGLGVCIALAWLTKGTALILVPATMLWLAVRRFDRNRVATAVPGLFAAALFLTLFAIVAAPLLMRNVTRFGSPTHNVNTWLMFVDEYEDPAALSETVPLGELARRYAAEKGAAGLVQRELRGLVWEAFILLRALGPVGLGEWRMFPGLMVAWLVLRGLLVTTRLAERTLALLWLIPSFALFAWYVPIAAGERFPAPLVPILLVYAAIGAAHLLQRTGSRQEAPQTGGAESTPDRL